MGRRMCSAPPARGALRHQGVAAVATGVKRTGAVMACQRVGVAAKARGGGSDGGSVGVLSQLVAAAGVSSVAVSSMCRAAAPSASSRAATGLFVWPLPAASSPAQQRLWSEDRQAGARSTHPVAAACRCAASAAAHLVLLSRLRPRSGRAGRPWRGRPRWLGRQHPSPAGARRMWGPSCASCRSARCHR